MRRGQALEFVPIDSLTVGHDTGAQVILSPQFWESPSPSLGYRTNTTYAKIALKLQNCQHLHVVWGTDTVSYVNGFGKDMKPVLGTMAHRVGPDEDHEFSVGDTDWIYHANVDFNGQEILTGLGDGYVEMEVTTPPWAFNQSTWLECMREPEDGGSDNVEHGGIMQLLGFYVNPGCTFDTISYSKTAVNFVVYGDSHKAGFVETEGYDGPESYLSKVIVTGRTGLLTLHPNGVAPVRLDIRGSTVEWWRTMIDTWCIANNRRPVILNTSQPGRHQAVRMGPTLLSFYQNGDSSTGNHPVFPGIWDDLQTIFARRTNDSSTDFSVGGDWTGGFTPDVAILSSFTNDFNQQAAEHVKAPTEFRFDSAISGDSSAAVGQDNDRYIDDLSHASTGLIPLLRAKWSSLGLFSTGSLVSIARVPGWAATPLMIQPQIDNVFGTVYTGSDTWQEHIEFDGTFPTSFPGYSSFRTHLNTEDHEVVRAGYQSTFNTLMTALGL